MSAVTVASRLQAPALLRDASAEAQAAVARRSPEAAYWYARDAAHAARILGVHGCPCDGCANEHGRRPCTRN